MTVQIAGIGFAAGPPARGTSSEAAVRPVRVVMSIEVFIFSVAGDLMFSPSEVRLCCVVSKPIVGCGPLSEGVGVLDLFKQLKEG